MRKRVLSAVRNIVFLLTLIGSLYFINQILMPKYILKNSVWPTTSSYNQFYDMEEDSVDVLFLGSSVVVNAFSPQEVYNHYGIRSYNLGSEQQSIFLSYFWLKEALRFQLPQVVVLDTRFLFELHPGEPINTVEELTRKCLDPMRFSEVKREAISELCDIDREQSELSYYLKNIRFHARWSALTEYDFIKNESSYSELKGYAPIADYGSMEYLAFTSTGDVGSRQQTHETMHAYLDRIVALCKNKGITLVLVSLPGNTMNDAYNNTLVSYAQVNGIDYYNMCDEKLYNSIGATLPKENMIEHENIWGAAKMSQYVGRLLSSVYNVPAVEDQQYECTREFYAHIIKNCELIHITDMNAYLQAINDGQYTIFIAAREGAATSLTDDVKQSLGELGLQADLNGKAGWSYSAVISPENGVSEILTEKKPAKLSGSIRDRKTFYSLTSCGDFAGWASSIIIDGEEYCRSTRGLNFVIYDNYLMKVIDCVTFDTYRECRAAR